MHETARPLNAVSGSSEYALQLKANINAVSEEVQSKQLQTHILSLVSHVQVMTLLLHASMNYTHV